MDNFRTGLEDHVIRTGDARFLAFVDKGDGPEEDAQGVVEDRARLDELVTFRRLADPFLRRRESFARGADESVLMPRRPHSMRHFLKALAEANAPKTGSRRFRIRLHHWSRR
jgi:hypothetical protein